MTHRDHVNLFFATQLWLHNRKGTASQRYLTAMRAHDVDTMQALTPELLELHGRQRCNDRAFRNYMRKAREENQ